MAADTSTFEHVRGFALGLPEAQEDHPWGETAIKVRGKAFVFLGSREDGLRLSVKLPKSKEFALEYPFTKPTRYGLGKSGWATASFGPDAPPPRDILEAWIAESYRAVAPNSALAKLTAGSGREFGMTDSKTIVPARKHRFRKRR